MMPVQTLRNLPSALGLSKRLQKHKIVAKILHFTCNVFFNTYLFIIFQMMI